MGGFADALRAETISGSFVLAICNAGRRRRPSRVKVGGELGMALASAGSGQPVGGCGAGQQAAVHGAVQ